jgi:hypothetical protein
MSNKPRRWEKPTGAAAAAAGASAEQITPANQISSFIDGKTQEKVFM